MENYPFNLSETYMLWLDLSYFLNTHYLQGIVSLLASPHLTFWIYPE